MAALTLAMLVASLGLRHLLPPLAAVAPAPLALSQFGIVAHLRYRSLRSVPHWTSIRLHPPLAAADYGPPKGGDSHVSESLLFLFGEYNQKSALT